MYDNRSEKMLKTRISYVDLRENTNKTDRTEKFY